VEETGDAYVVELELPGAKREDISVELGGGELVATGEVSERKRMGLLRARIRPVGRFHYRVSLPAEVKEDEVTASLAEGVLTVRVPKTEKARQRKIRSSPRDGGPDLLTRRGSVCPPRRCRVGSGSWSTGCLGSWGTWLRCSPGTGT
jgi:hypothetical protein